MSDLITRPFRDDAPDPIPTGLTRLARRREHRMLNTLLRKGRRAHAFDDGTVHVLDGHIEARQTQFSRRLDGATTVRRHRAAQGIARAAKTVERRQGRLQVLESRLRRVDEHAARTESVLLGRSDAPAPERVSAPLAGPAHLSGYTLRQPLSVAAPEQQPQPDNVSHIHSQPETSDR